MTTLNFRPISNRRFLGRTFLRFFFLKRSSPLCCRRRYSIWRRPFCCSVETMRVLMKLLLLCVASCSWSLLIISLSLSTTRQPSRYMETEIEQHVEEDMKKINPCLLCKSHEGPSKAFVRTFHRPLKHILMSVNNLDLPLAPNDLRVHLAVLRVILNQLLRSLNVTMTHDRLSNNSTNKSVVLANEIRPAIAVVDISKKYSKLACPDRYLGSLAGYPRYKKGFVVNNCTSTRLDDIVTIVIWNVDNSPNLFTYWTIPNMQIFVVSNISVNDSASHIHYVYSESTGDAIHSVLRNISTPYVLLAPNLHSLKDDINFNRLIYVSERTGAAAIGGSIRSEEDGRWRSGCQLYKEFEGQISFKRAYSASVFECQLCHFADGPVLVKTKWLKGSDWPQKSLTSEMLMPYLFFQLNHGIKSDEHPVLVCPDVMFRYNSIVPPWDTEYTKSTFIEKKFHLQSLWDLTSRTRFLTSINLSSGMKLHYPCNYLQTLNIKHNNLNEYVIKNKSNTKTGMRACKEAELEHILLTIIHKCEEAKILCALDEKFVGVLTQYGDPLLFHQKFPKIPVEVEAVGKNDTYQRLKEIFLSQSNGINTNNGSILINGYFWTIEITLQEISNLFQFKRIQVLENLWMKGHLSQAVFDPFAIFGSTSNQTRSNVVKGMIKDHPEGQGQEFLRVTSERFEDEAQEWEFFASKHCI